MRFTADLHIHSRFSRATSKAADLEGYSQWARIKGLQLLGTGDFTHPGWFEEISGKLIPAETGLFRLREQPPAPAELEGLELPQTPVRYCLSAEISSIYKKGDRTRKVHSLIFAPDMETARRINARLDMLGNIRSDGRPILGLDPKKLLEILLDISEQAFLIPAHIWTPWFSLLGSKSGFDSVQECFEELTPHIFAVETGLSSDPSMNWRCSFLDRCVLVSHSDAHSPIKLGREADVFDTELSYPAVFEALKSRRGFIGTLEFHPEEGKYHWDGHRKCGVCLDPEETAALGGICPVCGKKLTVGVLHRVLELADRPAGTRPDETAGFRTLIPLPEILSEIHGSGPQSKSILSRYRELLAAHRDELTILLETPLGDLEAAGGPLLAEAVGRMRRGETHPRPGFDGEFGVIRCFEAGELESLRGQGTLFALPPAGGLRAPGVPGGAGSAAAGSPAGGATAPGSPAARSSAEPARLDFPAAALNAEQEAAAASRCRAAVVTAGPGTGKTRTLIAWISRLIREAAVRPTEVLAVTFTNRAADEMRSRLRAATGEAGAGVRIGTFHSLCFELLKERDGDLANVSDRATRLCLLRHLEPDLSENRLRKLSERFERAMEASEPQPEDSESEALLRRALRAYRELLDRAHCVDVSELVTRVNALLESDPTFRASICGRFRYMAVDEFQDINPAQYRLLEHLAGEDEAACSLFAIGDPDQAIYAFRGSDAQLFDRFAESYGARRVNLVKNYRSREVIVRAADALIGRPGRLDAVHGQEAVMQGGRIRTMCAGEPEEESRFIADRIEELIGGSSHVSVDAMRERDIGGYAYSDIAVLCRTRAVRNTTARGLAGRGIPCSLAEHASFSLSPQLGEAVALLKLALDPFDPAGLASVLPAQPGFDRRTVRRILQTAPRESDSLCSLARRADAPGDGPEAGQRLERVRELELFLDDLRRTLETGGTAAGLKEIFGRCMERRPEEADREAGSQAELEAALEREMLLETARAFDRDAAGFLKRISLSPFESEGRGAAESVRLLTFHAAKGMEFPVVFIAGAEEGVAPLLRKDADLQEERRLFYVAVTRAMDHLIISCCGRRKRFGEWRPAEPSRFLADIPADLLTVERRRSERPRQLELF